MGRYKMKLMMMGDDRLRKVLEELIEKDYMAKNTENPREYGLTEIGLKHVLAKGLGKLF